jgi:hypothetical protein
VTIIPNQTTNRDAARRAVLLTGTALAAIRTPQQRSGDTAPVVDYFGDFDLSAMPLDEGEQQELHVSVEHRLDAASLVALWQEAGDGAELEMTSAEAREVALAILAAADCADGITPAGPCTGGVSWCDGSHTDGAHDATTAETTITGHAGTKLAVVLEHRDGSGPWVIVEQVAGVEAAVFTVDEALQHALGVLRAVAFAGGTK